MVEHFRRKKISISKRLIDSREYLRYRDIELSLFSAQISGFSADFHRKSLDIVKQHSNNAGILADTVF